MPKIGELLEGKVTRISEKGAFVELEDKKTGFLHISEISKGFVKNVSDHLKVNDIVKVRVIDVDPKRNRISLSIKKTDDEFFEKMQKVQFENKIKKFLNESSEKLRQIQKSTESKQGVRKKVSKKKKEQ